MGMRVMSLLTDFRHHGDQSGYKQILQYIQPLYTLGVNERTGIHTSGMRSKYQWIFEFDMWRHKGEVDLIHIMYGEDYLRFSPVLYPDIPIVATFHQPAEVLEREVARGDLKGRVGHLTHLLARGRFRRLAAAIVTETSQKEVLSKVMPAERVHVIPLGVHLSAFHEAYKKLKSDTTVHEENNIVTVGNWLRDWDFYFRVLEYCNTVRPAWRFKLINRRLDDVLREKVQRMSNLQWEADVTNEKMRQILYTSRLHFLPVHAASGNNALLESIAMGCPAVLTDVFSQGFFIGEPAVWLYEKGNLESAFQKLDFLMNLDRGAYQNVKEATFARSADFDWSEVANKTMNVFQSVLKK